MMKTSYIFNAADFDFPGLKDVRFVVVASRWHFDRVDSMVCKALKHLQIAGVMNTNVQIYYVPGAMEIPVVVKKVLAQEKADIVLVFGAIIKGDTYHFEMVADACNLNLNKLAVDYGVPIIQQVLAVNNEEQLLIRTADDQANKGIEAAIAALQMAKLVKTELY